MKMRTAVVFILLLALAMSPAFAEGNQETGSAGKLDEVEVVMRSFAQVNWDGSSFDQLVQEKFGLKMKVEVIDMASYAEKFKVMFSTNNLPDLSTVFGIDISQLNEAGDRGLFLDYYDYVDQMPELKKLLVENANLIPYITAASGSLYYSPLYYGRGDRLNDKGIAVRKDLLDAAGFDYSNLETWDDFYEMLVALKNQQPDRYVISCQYGLGNLFLQGSMMNLDEKPGRWDEASESWIASYRQPALKDFISMWAKAYDDDILHPDFLTMQRNDMQQMYKNGELTAYVDSLSYLDGYDKDAAGDDWDWDFVVPPKYNGVRYGMPSFNGFGWINQKIVNAKTKAPEKIMDFIDWTYSDEGFMRSWYGEEGVDYVLLNENPLEWIQLDANYRDTIPAEYHDRLLTTEEITKRRADLPYYLYGFYSKNTPWGAFGKYRAPNDDSQYYTASMVYIDEGLFAVPNPNIALLGDDLEEFNKIQSNIVDYSQEIIAQMITGRIDIETGWQDFQDTLTSLKYDRLMELYAKSAENFFEVEPKFQP